MAGEAKEIKGKKQRRRWRFSTWNANYLYIWCFYHLPSIYPDFLISTPFLSVKPVTTTSEKEKKITHHNICWTSRRIAFFCPSLFSKSWRRSVKPSGPSWMEDMTTFSASWHHVWDWRNLIWRTPYWKEIRQYILGFFCWKSFHVRSDMNLLWENCCQWTERIFDFEILLFCLSMFSHIPSESDVSDYECCVTLFDSSNGRSNSLPPTVCHTSCSSIRSQSQ